MKISNLYKEIFCKYLNKTIKTMKKINHLINIIINLKIQEIVEIPFKVTRI